MGKIDWKLIWSKFNDWYEKEHKKTICSKCNRGSQGDIDWEDQKREIERLVEAWRR